VDGDQGGVQVFFSRTGNTVTSLVFPESSQCAEWTRLKHIDTKNKEREKGEESGGY